MSLLRQLSILIHVKLLNTENKLKINEKKFDL